MAIFKRIFDFYLQGSLHVGLSCFALVEMTQYMFHIHGNEHIGLFAFSGTIVGYNFVKYDALARTQKVRMSVKLKSIAVLSFFASVIAAWTFFQFRLATQLTGLVFLALMLLYTLPFFPNRSNARNWAGIKIYIVSLCWVGITVALPVLDAGIDITSDFLLKCVQRFILIFILVIIFEIIDLKYDDPHLHTVPQQIGVKNTKILGIVLLVLLYCLEFLRISIELPQLLINLFLISITALFLVFANENKSRYYTAFWVESIPILWWLLLLFV